MWGDKFIAWKFSPLSGECCVASLLIKTVCLLHRLLFYAPDTVLRAALPLYHRAVFSLARLNLKRCKQFDLCGAINNLHVYVLQLVIDDVIISGTRAGILFCFGRRCQILVSGIIHLRSTSAKKEENKFSS